MSAQVKFNLFIDTPLPRSNIMQSFQLTLKVDFIQFRPNKFAMVR